MSAAALAASSFGRFLRSARRLGLRVALATAVAFAALWVLFPYPAARLEEYPSGAMVLDREGRLLRVFASSRGEFRFPVRLAEMSPWIAKATLAIEDRHFRVHPGVNPFAIARALAQNLARGRIHSGASTLTQQLVRILDERPRTLPSKAIEAFRALQLESQRSKDDLLEAYLNLAPYGGNLRGVEAASLRYFGKRARDLDASEAALLAGLPQSPSRLRPDRHLDRALRRQRAVLDAMVRAGHLSAAERDELLGRPPRVLSRPWPLEAPHFAELARRRATTSGGAPGAAVRTTLDPAAQRLSERRLAEFFAGPAPGRARLTGAAVVVEASTGAVRALVGSPGYFDEARRGALNGALRPRSPGSALKPFLYALAFDRGAASPETCLWDVPLALGRYAPENYDRSYRGPVRAREALASSLNVPAVELLRAVGTQDFIELLRGAGLETLEPSAERYGLQLALGGCEVRLLDLAAAYAALIRLGIPSEAKVLEAELRPEARPGSERRILSPGACELVLECLSEDAHLRRALPEGRPGGSGFLAFKTGTSFGHRDAWAFALTSRYVVGVWIGDPGGRPDPVLVGAEAALPVALAIAGALGREGDPAPWESPGGPFVETAPVCALSGRPAGPSCPRVVLGRFPAGSPRPRPCDLHREILVERESGFEVCGGCRKGRDVDRRAVEVFPPEVESWLSRSGLGAARATRAPPHDPSCRHAASEGSPRIVSPADGAVFRRSAEGARAIDLAAAPHPGAARLWWFVDGELVGTSPPLGRLAWPLEAGTHSVRCVDDRGRGALARFEVR